MEPRLRHALPLAAALLAATASGAFAQQLIGGCPVLPANNIWNTPVEHLSVLANSTAMVNTIGSSSGFHADFGSGTWNGGPIGIPFVTVRSTQAAYPASFLYDDESDPGPYAVPLDAPIEGGSASNGDRHALALDTDRCILYELYRAFPGTGSWTADSGAIYDLRSNALRPATWTSADAAGLPILPGLVTYDEVASGEIRHAIRFTAPQTRREFVWPARHYASNRTGTQYPRMGERFRLKASYDISGYPPEVQVILRAMKKYGIILADNGSSWYISGAPDARWNNSNLHTLGQLRGSNFEAVDATVLMVDPNSGAAAQQGPDTDNDGVADSIDECPFQPGVAPTGCPAPPGPADLDGDGVPNTSDACPAVYAKTPNGCPVLPLGRGDLNGDGKPDILFQHATTRMLYAWWLRDGSFVGDTYLNPGVAPSVNDLIVSKDDFNLDGQMDLLWQNQVTGLVTIWLMQGPRRTSAVSVMSSPDWRIVGTPDLNSDGYPDVVWQRYADGALYYYLLALQGSAPNQQLAITGAGPILNAGGQPSVSGPDWRVVAVGDLNGDQRPDLVFQKTTGLRDVRAWYLGGPNGISVINAGILLLADARGWRVRMLSDMNSDGFLDIVWQNQDLAIPLYQWLLDGAGNRLAEGFLLPLAPVPQDWRIVGGK
jgi:hypothetical protein